MNNKIGENKAGGEKSKSVSFLIGGIEARIEEACTLVGGKRAMSNKTGIHETQLYRYISGENGPSANVLVVIAETAGVNLQWLATGEGPQLVSESGRPTDPTSTARDDSQITGSTDTRADTIIDTATLTDVFEALNNYQRKRRIRWQPRDEARIAAEIYQYLIEQDQPTAEDRARAVRLVTSVIEGMHERVGAGQRDD